MVNWKIHIIIGPPYHIVDIALQNSRHFGVWTFRRRSDGSGEYDSSMEKFRFEPHINIIILIKQFW